MPRSCFRSASTCNDEIVRPGWIRTGDRTRQGGDLGGERAGISDVLEGQFVESAAEVPEVGKAVEKARGEGVAGTDGVDDHRRRGCDGDAHTVEGREGAAPAEGDDDETRAGGMLGVAGLSEAGTGSQEGTVVFARAEDVGDGTPVVQPFAVGGGRYEHRADVGVCTVHSTANRPDWQRFVRLARVVDDQLP